MAVKVEFDIGLSPTHLDLAVLEVLIFVLVWNIEKENLGESGLSMSLDVYKCIFGQGIRIKHQNEPIMPIFYISDV